MPVSLTTIIAPVVLFSTMPPVTGVGGASLTMIVFCPVVCRHDVLSRRDGRRRGRQDRHLRHQAPEAAGPDRIVGIPLLEFHPDL
jgi:hypothetical protein